jgi:arabinan endo-1,5-alpha-L-arabinosidase
MKKSYLIFKFLSISIIFLLVFSINSCAGDDDQKPNPDPDPIVVGPNTFPGPTYADNYTSISSWQDCSKWNLANVHGPTVEKCGEYYDMYQKDFSYGNAHKGYGHFPYRRSKDLVIWEYMGSAMAKASEWVKDSLNNKRARMIPALPQLKIRITVFGRLTSKKWAISTECITALL